MIIIILNIIGFEINNKLSIILGDDKLAGILVKEFGDNTLANKLINKFLAYKLTTEELKTEEEAVYLGAVHYLDKEVDPYDCCGCFHTNNGATIDSPAGSCRHDIVKIMCLRDQDEFSCCRCMHKLAEYSCAKDGCSCFFHKQCLPTKYELKPPISDVKAYNISRIYIEHMARERHLNSATRRR
jgi:hypothetical protein